MPRMPARLSINQASNSTRYRPSQSSHLTATPSPTSPTPLHPPARLHLRPIISPLPLSSSFLASAPDVPYPWIWRCHICHSVYSLGVTRRCLEDGHFFCSLPNQNTSSPPSVSSDCEFLSVDELAEKSKEERRKRKRRPRQACRSEFDYTGWNKYNIWRREAHIIQAENNGISPTGKGPHLPNCWIECDFPSECHNTRLERLRAMRKAVELSKDHLHFNSQESEAQQETAEIEAQIENMLDDSSPIKPLLAPSNPQKEALEMGRCGSHSDADHVNVSDTNLDDTDLEDEMGPKEVEFVQKKRKKSIQKIRQLTGLSLGTETYAMEIEASPPSPLKMQFAAEDMEDVDVKEEGVSKIDPQLEELLRTRNDYLRLLNTVDKDEELFGNEEIVKD